MLFGLISPNTPVTILFAGDSEVWTFYDADHPSSVWSGQFVLNRNGVQLLSKATVASSDNHIVSLVSADTTTLAPGPVDAFLVFTSGAIRETEYAGSVILAPNPTGSITPTPAQQALTAVKTTIATILAQPESSASFNGQTYTMQNINDLFKARNLLQSEVNAEYHSMGIRTTGTFKTILTRFR